MGSPFFCGLYIITTNYDKLFFITSIKGISISVADSKLPTILASLPSARLNFASFHDHPALPPRIVTPELSLVLVPVLEVHFPEALHLACLELANILYPVHIIEPIEYALAVVVVVSPFPVVFEIAIRVVQFALPLHLALEPVSVVVAAIPVQIFPFAVSQVIFLLPRIHIAIRVQLA